MSALKIILRIGKGRNGYKVAASLKRNPMPLTESRGGELKPIPTVQVRLAVDLAPSAFDLAEIAIPLDNEQLEAMLLSARAE